MKFVKADLEEANKNRDVRPWIITMGHRPMYCSNGNHEGACLTEDTFHRNGTLDGVKVGLEEIFHDNKVDLCLSGHEHSYGSYSNALTHYGLSIEFDDVIKSEHIRFTTTKFPTTISKILFLNHQTQSMS